MATPQTVTFTVLDKEYQVSCKEDERADLEAAAIHLDHKMNAIRQSGRIVGLDRIAVMAGLNISHDLITENNKKSGLTLGINERIKALQNKVDFAVNNFSK